MTTLQQAIDDGARTLRRAGVVCGHGTDNEYDEAAWLALHAIGLSPAAPAESRELDAAEAVAIQRWIERRIDSRQPAAYLIGEAWFAGYPFTISNAVLVPRSPIAELIRDQYAPWLQPQQLGRVLDLCTGSGCIGIASALHLPWLEVDLSDISAPALDVARINIERHQVGDRVRAVQSDWFDGLVGREYDLIVSNPPYVPVAEARSLPAEYQAEPAIGLASGHDGLDAAAQILTRAAAHLRPRGHLILEVGDSWRRLDAALGRLPLTWLEFSDGGDGVCLLQRDDLLEAADQLQSWLEERQRSE
ncbi:MAG: 50S ribosomal protein L3 N(5)-glutamine methyltransferase [Wenzhouxiangellaceae bacterium]